LYIRPHDEGAWDRAKALAAKRRISLSEYAAIALVRLGQALEDPAIADHYRPLRETGPVTGRQKRHPSARARRRRT
jgi:hypothetical protein